MVSVDEVNISYVMKYYKDTNIVDNYLNSIGLDKNQSAEMKKHITSEKVIEDSIKKWKTMIEKTKKKIDGGRKRKTKKHRRKKRGKGKTRKIQRGGNGILATLTLMTGIIGISAALALVLLYVRPICSDIGGACLDRILPITEEDNYLQQRQRQRQRQQRQQQEEENARALRRRQGDYDSDTETKESAANARDQ